MKTHRRVARRDFLRLGAAAAGQTAGRAQDAGPLRVRRVVIGQDAAGRSRVVIDEPASGHWVAMVSGYRLRVFKGRLRLTSPDPDNRRVGGWNLRRRTWYVSAADTNGIVLFPLEFPRENLI